MRILALLNISNKARPLWHRLRQGFRSTNSRSVEIVLEHLWPEGSGLLLPAGNYKYPFEICLPSDLAESIQGLPEISLKYRVDATVVDKGTLMFHGCKDLRIIRTPALDALDPLQSAGGELIWDDKLKYSISIFPKAVSFGGTIHLNLCAYPLESGIKLGDVALRIIENRELSIENRFRPATKARKYIAEISTDQRDITLSSVGKGWMYKASVALPRRLGDCVQNLAYNKVRVSHTVEAIMPVKELDGHEFEVNDRRPVLVH